MRNANHTPGPWEHGNNGLIYGQCGEDDVEAPFVCDVIEDSAMQALGMLSPVEEANARLIAAAPELLKALEDLLADIDDLASEFAISKEIANSSYGQAARAAIAKATGRAA